MYYFQSLLIVKINNLRNMLLLMFMGITMFWEDVAIAHVQVFPGGHFKELHPLTIYESSIPLTYIINQNSFNFIELSNFSLPTCPFSDRHLVRLTGMATDLDKQIEEQQRKMVPRFNISSRTARGQRAIEAIGDFLHWSFGTATDSQLHTLTDNEDAVNKHLNSLQDIVKGDHLDLVHTVNDIKGFSSNVSQVLAKVKAALKGIEGGLKYKVPEEEVYRRLLSYVVRLQAQIYRSLFIDDFEDILVKCRASLLSTSFVSREVLDADIKKLEKKMIRDSYEIALPTANLELFYTLPITSCNISPEKLIVTVKIPVKNRRDKWTLYEYIPSPLAWKEYTCVLSREPIYVAVSRDTFVTIAGKQLDNCKEKRTGMCQIPRQRQGGSVSTTCAEKMFKKGTVDELRASCPFYCDATRRGILITEVGVDSYIITHPSKHISINCSNSSLTIPSQFPGAFEIILPCDCILSEGNSTLISKKYPCGLHTHDPFVTHILPVSWTSLRNISLDPLEKLARPNFLNYSDVLDMNWNLVSPAFVVHNNIPDTAFDHVELPKTWYDVYDTPSLKYYVLFTWLGVLSLFNIYIVIKMYVNGKINMAVRPPPIPPRG